MIALIPAVVETIAQLILFIFFAKIMLDENNEMTFVYFIMNTESGAEYELTCCVGYCRYSGDVAAFQAAMAKADEALYKEKAELGTPRQ